MVSEVADLESLRLFDLEKKKITIQKCLQSQKCFKNKHIKHLILCLTLTILSCPLSDQTFEKNFERALYAE